MIHLLILLLIFLVKKDGENFFAKFIYFSKISNMTVLLIRNNDLKDVVADISWFFANSWFDELSFVFPNPDNIDVPKSIDYCEKRKQELDYLHKLEVKKCKMVGYIEECEYVSHLALVTDRDYMMEMEDCDHDHHKSDIEKYSRLSRLSKLLQSLSNCKMSLVSQ
jgi:hypothetical protein